MKGQSILKLVQLIFAIACITMYRYGPKLSILGSRGDALQPVRLDKQKLDTFKVLTDRDFAYDQKIAYQGLQLDLTQTDVQLFGSITYGTFLIYTAVALFCYIMGNGAALRSTYMEIIFNLLGAGMYITTGSLVGEFYGSRTFHALLYSYEIYTGGSPTGLAVVSVITGAVFLTDAVWALIDKRNFAKNNLR